jgi:hypothetical protein
MLFEKEEEGKAPARTERKGWVVVAKAAESRTNTNKKLLRANLTKSSAVR